MSISVLVLEEDPDLQDLIVETLEVADFVAKGAESSQEALKLLRQRRFDVSISQVRTASLKSDVAALELLHQRGAGIHCIVITQHDCVEQLPEAFQANVVFKPLRMPALLEAVKRVTAVAEPGNALWAALVAMPKKLMQKADAGRREHALQALQAERLRALRGLHAAIHSGLLSLGAALDCWDRLVILEKESAQPTDAHSLSNRYHQVFELMRALVKAKSQGTFAKRSPQDVDRASFHRFFDRIRADRIGPEQMEWAWSAWTTRLSPKDEQLSVLMWGAEPEPKKSESNKAEAKKPEPQKTEPKKAEAKKLESKKSEPNKAEAKKPEFRTSEPLKTEPKKAEVKRPEPGTKSVPLERAEPTPLGAPVAAPIGVPIASPVAAPIGVPIAWPVAAPIGVPIASPVATPIATPIGVPIASPVATPLGAPVPGSPPALDKAKAAQEKKIARAQGMRRKPL